MKEIRIDKPQVLTPICKGIGGDYKTFSASAADLQMQVEMQIQGLKNAVEELNERFRAEVLAKQLWVSHRLVFVEKRDPEVVWFRNGWGGRAASPSLGCYIQIKPLVSLSIHKK